MQDRRQDNVQLRPVEDDDLETFWQQLSDPQLQHMAGVTRRYHYDRGAFDQFWAKIRVDPVVVVRTITAGHENRRPRSHLRAAGRA